MAVLKALCTWGTPKKTTSPQQSFYTMTTTLPPSYQYVGSEDNSERTDVDVECALGNASQEINIIGSI